MMKISIINILNDLLSIFDIEALIRYGGLLIVLLTVYGSTGLFFCFFIPTGAVLFTAGIFVATGGAGMVRLNFRRFILLTLTGSVVWILSFVLMGYFIGSRPFLKPWLKYIVIAFILVITIPLIIWIRKELRKLRKENRDRKGM